MLKNLDSDDRENFDGDPVELIKAAPSASLSETHEDVAARLVVHLLAAVEHVDHDADRPPEVLRRLGLPSSSRTLGRAPHHQVQGLREGDVAPGQVDEKVQSVSPVSKWGDDQAWGVPEVLVAVPELCVADVCKAVLFNFVPPSCSMIYSSQYHPTSQVNSSQV